MPLPGEFVDGYELVRRLGRGAMGEIWQASDPDGDDVAIKLLQRELSREPELVERFEREIERSGRIQHPNVIQVLGGGRAANGQLYMVMEVLKGRPLAMITATEAPLPPLRLAELGRQIASGLGAAHAQGIVHRDMKAENVMVQRDGAGDLAKVFDFGLSLGTGSRKKGQERLTAVGLRLGTPATMAPEYILDGEVDGRGDLYALGVVLYELACGRLPFEGSAYELMHRHCNEPVPPLAERCEAPGWLCDAIEALLRKEPDDRPQDGAAAVVLLTPPSG